MDRICPPTHLLDHIHCGDGRLRTVSPRINLFATTFRLLDPRTRAVSSCFWRTILIIQWFSPGQRSLVTDSSTDTLLPLPLLLVPLLHWMHRAMQSAPTLCPSLLHAAEDSHQSSWHALLQRLARTLQASVQARTRPRRRNSAQPTPARDCHACDCHRPILPATGVFVH